MKITHHTNSFIEIEAHGYKIVCDPWFNPANHGGWKISPVIPEYVYLKALQSADLLYISHLHSDHLDEKLLTKFAQHISADILVPLYANKHLYERLKKILPNNKCIPLHPKQQFSPIDCLDLYIYPQQASSQSSQPSDECIFRYELDSSLLVIDRRLNISFFNQVDNPLSTQNVLELRDFLGSIAVDRLDCLCMAVGAASQYPQCFLGLNLIEAKSTLLARLLAEFRLKIAILNPKFFFPAGGDYQIGGSYSSLNKYKATPSSNDLEDAVTSCVDSKYIDLRGGKSLEISAADCSIKQPENDVLSSTVRLVDEVVHSGLVDDSPSPECRELIKDLFSIAKTRFESKVCSIGSIAEAVCMPRYHFVLYPTTPSVVENDNILSVQESSVPSSVLVLNSLANSNNIENVIDYEFHMSESDFRCLLSRVYSWNQYVSGSNCLMRRSQNTHIAWHEMLLNLFVL